MFLGNFTNLRSEVVLWRVKMLMDILADRTSTMKERAQACFSIRVKLEFSIEFFKRIQIWVIVTSDEDKKSIQESLKKPPGPKFTTQIFSLMTFGVSLKNYPDK